MIAKTLGHYQISAQLGKGGMGEVYQAKDQKLGRDVAIKVLPEEFARDADRVARFQREAKVLASLNHPNIAAIYGLEAFDNANFLVLELVQGETLADRIKAGPIPVEESLKLALQIAEALEAAHEKGIIHRDLKPANIKVTSDGKVKVLDFGLAKAFAGEQEQLNLSNSPTLSNMATQQGIILGTAAYMSPEQASGQNIDKRADIWAFGVVLFEMLTGRSLFAGDSVSQTLARVLERQPDFSLLPPNLHFKVVELLRRCLQKESKNRYHDIADIRLDLQEVLADPSGVFVQPVSIAEQRKKPKTILLVAITAILSIIIAGLAVWNLKPLERHQVIRFDYDLPEGQQFIRTLSSTSVLAVSPDGKQFVYGTTKGLYLRSVDELTAKLIPGTEGETQEPFFSPDGKWIGYYSDQKLKKININGGAPVTLCEVAPFMGASWSEDNTIIYSQGQGGGIMRISANGGTPQSILKQKSEKRLSFPQILPGGKSVLYFSLAPTLQRRIVVQSLRSGETKELFEGYAARYLPTGHIVYGLPNNNNLFAIPFNLDKLEVEGSPVPIVEGVIGGSQYAVSESGTLVYMPGTGTESTSVQRTLVWVDRAGKEEPLTAPLNSCFNPRISPDGTRVALNIGYSIWIWDLVHKTLTRLTFEGTINAAPLWTPDSKRIAFLSYREGKNSVYWKAADGAGKDEILGALPDTVPVPFSWSDNGKTMVLSEWNRENNGYNIGMLSMEGDRKYKSLLNEKYHEVQPQISPDGRWMVYTSDESGQNQIYVRPFPDVNSGRWQISTSGGDSPLWSPNGREILYRNGDAVMAVSVKTAPAFSMETPKILFRGTYFSNVFSSGSYVFATWDISPDGKRFLMLKEQGTAGLGSTGPRKINIVINWFEELKQRVPAK